MRGAGLTCYSSCCLRAGDGRWVFPRIRLARHPAKPTGARPSGLSVKQAVEVRGWCWVNAAESQLGLGSMRRRHMWLLLGQACRPAPAAATSPTCLAPLYTPTNPLQREDHRLLSVHPLPCRSSCTMCGGGARWCTSWSSRGW